MSEYAWKSATALAEDIRQGRIGALELLNHFIDRVERHDNRINAVIIRDFERARERAREADGALARGENWGPLHGVPMTVKESFDIAGLKTCWGVTEMRDNTPDQDSVVVQRLKSAGAVIFGKTNIPFMLSDFQSYNEVYGTTHNPWRQGHTPGGSSGGGAAALAAGFTPLEFGSDIGGSIRNPAHYSGVFGHKPTWGVIPLRGHSLMGGLAPSDISVVGPLARTADDLDLAFSLTAGSDRLHNPGWALEMPEGPVSAQGLRVAVWDDDAIAPVDADIRASVQAAARALADAGAEIDDTARPAFDPGECMRIYQHLLWSTMAARQPDALYDANVAEAAKLSDDDDSDGARVLRAQTTRFRDWAGMNELRWRMRYALADFFDKYDVLLCPVASVAAFPHDESRDLAARKLVVNGKSVPYFQQLFWAGFTGVSYLPGTVYPAGPRASGLPVGIQIVGPEMGDRKTIAVARLLEQHMGGFQTPPGFD